MELTQHTKKKPDAKYPAFQFYPGDWLKDISLRRCSFAAKGVLIDALCILFDSEERGVFISGNVPWSIKEIANVIGGNTDAVSTLFLELIAKGVIKQREDGAYYSARMVRDQELRLVRQRSGSMGGNPAVVKNYNIPGFIYLIEREDGAVKIGISQNPTKRLYKLRYEQKDSTMKLVGTMPVKDMGKTEAEFHAKYQHCCIGGGGEWFNIAPDELLPLKGQFKEGDKGILEDEDEDEDEEGIPEERKRGLRGANRLPDTEQEAVEWCAAAGIPPSFAAEVFNQCAGRGWVDGAGQAITSFRHYAKRRFTQKQGEPKFARPGGRPTPQDHRATKVARECPQPEIVVPDL